MARGEHEPVERLDAGQDLIERPEIFEWLDLNGGRMVNLGA